MPPPAPRTIILSPRFAHRGHGTGVQLLRLARELPSPPFQFCWDGEKGAGAEGIPTCNLYADWRQYWPWAAGAGFLQRLQKKLGPADTFYPAVDLRAARQALVAENISPAVAYVVISSEEEARVANALLEILNCPYVTNTMDLLHVEPLTPERHPQLKRLMERAGTAFAISETLAESLASLSGRKIEVLLPGSFRGKESATAPEGAGPLKIALCGIDYSTGLALLEALVPELISGRFELHYSGPEKMWPKLSNVVGARAIYHGQLDDERFDLFLAQMHAAYLPGPNLSPALCPFSRFSIPSRLGNYFFHGLPVAAHLHPASATYRYLKPIVGRGVLIAPEGNALRDIFRTLRDNAQAWTNASQAVLQMAADTMDGAVIFPRLAAELKACAAQAA